MCGCVRVPFLLLIRIYKHKQRDTDGSCMVVLYIGTYDVYIYDVYALKQELPVEQRGDAVSSLVYEANARMRDPVYGCVGAISYLQNQVSQLQMQLAVAQAEILCIQMHQDPINTITQTPSQIDHDHRDDKSFLLDHHHHHHQYYNFASPAGNVVIQDSLKRESLFGVHDLVS